MRWRPRGGPAWSWPPARLVVAGAVLATMAAAGLRAQQAGSQRPTFRAGVDVIELDVSVLDKDRHPVEGLTASDFTVLENGKPQQILTVSHVEAAERDPAQSAWMRYATRDVAVNDLTDQLGDGRLFTIVLDDANIPADSTHIVVGARAAARHVVDQLGPSDLAAVVFTRDAGETQDFTSDHAKLLDAIDQFQPDPNAMDVMPGESGFGGADMPERFSPILTRSPCLRHEPTIPTLETVVSRMAAVPQRRKTLILLSVGFEPGMSGRSCASVLNDMARDVERTAQRANVNIYSIDPGGYRGYRDYLDTALARRGSNVDGPGLRLLPTDTRGMHEFLKTLSESTGGRAVLETDTIEPAIDRIFDEDGSYYLVGYETSNPKPDGKFRKVEVKVGRPGVSVRSRTGYWAPSSDAASRRRSGEGPAAADLTAAGLSASVGVPLRVTVTPIAPAASGGAGAAEVAVVLTVREPALRAPEPETLTIVRNLYDARGTAGPPEQERRTVVLQPAGGTDEVHYDVRQTLTLTPGHHQIRFNVTSDRLKTSGSVYADVEVPDFNRSPLSLSGLVLGPAREAAPADGAAPETAAVGGDAPASGLPVVPTTTRSFAPGDAISVFARIFQDSGTAPDAVTVTADVYDAGNAVRHLPARTFPATAFEGGRSAAFEAALPLAGLAHGPHLLSIAARLPGGRMARRDLVFWVR